MTVAAPRVQMRRRKVTGNGNREGTGDKKNNPATRSGVFLYPLKKLIKLRKT